MIRTQLASSISVYVLHVRHLRDFLCLKFKIWLLKVILIQVEWSYKIQVLKYLTPKFWCRWRVLSLLKTPRYSQGKNLEEIKDLKFPEFKFWLMSLPILGSKSVLPKTAAVLTQLWYKGWESLYQCFAFCGYILLALLHVFLLMLYSLHLLYACVCFVL